MALQKGRSGLVKLLRMSAKRQIDGFRGRKLPRTTEHAWCGVDLACRLEQEVLDRGMQVLAHHQARLRRHQHYICRGTVLGHVADAGGQDYLTQVRVQRNEGICPGYAGENDVLG